jgi:hypothetical protein
MPNAFLKDAAERDPRTASSGESKVIVGVFRVGDAVATFSSPAATNLTDVFTGVLSGALAGMAQVYDAGFVRPGTA